MRHIAPFARKRGYRVLSYSYKARQYSIRDHARALHRFLEAHHCEDDNLYFIGHSLGSIIVRFYIDMIEDQRKLTRIRMVMLGPPNHGSLVAKKLLPYRFVRERFGAPFDELAEGSFPPLKSGPTIGIIAGVLSNTFAIHPWYREPNDMLVSLSETKLEGSADHRIIRCPHALLMYAPSAIRQTFYFFEHGTFS